MSSPLISIEELTQALQTQRVRIVDTRWKLGDPTVGRQLFEASHIAGAIHLDMDRDLSGPPGGPSGRHPLPSADAFSDTMSTAGVDGETLVVAYDSGDGSGAARLWWLLRHFGHANVRVLDGGFKAWEAAGQPIQSGPSERPAPRRFKARERADDVVSTETLGRALDEGTVLLFDARGPERWRGDVEPIDTRPGRIPGAVNAPAGENLRHGRFKSPEELRDHYQQLGVTDASRVVASCGSGISACVDILGLESAGLTGAKLYPPSYSGWLGSDLPVERG